MPLAGRSSRALGARGQIGVRPEHITVGGAASVNAQVSVIEPTGAETFVSATLSGEEIVCVLKERVSCRPGDTLALSFALAPLHFFDAETGAAIRG